MNVQRQAVQFDRKTRTLIYYYRDEGKAAPVVGHGRPLAQITTLADSAANVKVSEGRKVGRIGGMQ